jgi:amidase
MSTFITSTDPGGGPGPLLAVKDLIDVIGVPTTAGSRAVADTAQPAERDAPCLIGARAAGARLVGKTNLFELAYGASGINEWFGTPVNPLDPALLPGGSSSGSAVAVATEAADVAFGSDTGGSIRVPSAFCGTAGLKTTHGRIPLGGVWPLAPTLDTVGPMARDVGGLVVGMQLLEPGFALRRPGAARLGRLRPDGVEVDPVIAAAVDAALRQAELDVVEVALPAWLDAYAFNTAILDGEAAYSNRRLTGDPALRAKLGPLVATRLDEAGQVPAAHVASARRHRARWIAELVDLLSRVEALVLPTVAFFPPPLEEAPGHPFTILTSPVNYAGLPALSLPVPGPGRLPAGLQLIGPAGAEDMLLATGLRIELALG